MAGTNEIVCRNESELKQAADLLLTGYPEGSIFAFYGDMGVGKTTFIKVICATRGVMDEVTSPTFNIVNEYQCPDGQKVYHMDFYRIKDLAEAMDIGYEEYFYSGDYCFIEWPEKVKQLLPPQTVVVKMIEDPADHSRRIQIQAQ